MRVILRCTVRGCPERLLKEGPRWTCSRNHSFDQNRFGALNLLQPQDRRSQNPGDSKEAARARRRLAEQGLSDGVYEGLAQVIRSRLPQDQASFLDVGCGEGGFVRSLERIPTLERHGLDLSSPSIDLAARASKDALFVVANADRFLPYVDRSFDFVTSIDARANASEFARVLKSSGLIFIALPGPDDLVELRERIQGSGTEKPRAGRIEVELGALFTLEDRTTVRSSRLLDPPALRDLLTVTYRGFRHKERVAVEALTAMNVTMSHEILAFRPR